MDKNRSRRTDVRIRVPRGQLRHRSFLVRRARARKERGNPMRKAVFVLLVAFCAKPVFAHHAFAAEFDAKKPIKLRGTVTKMEWINPHAWIHIDVKKPDGTVDEWMIEAGTPNTLLRRGFTKDSLKAGTEVIVDGYQ